MSALPPPPPVTPGSSASQPAPSPQPQAVYGAGDPSRGPIVVGILILVALVGVGLAVVRFTGTSEPCEDADFRSTLFRYCLTTPEGWIAGRPGTADAAVDQFAPSDEQAAIFVEANEAGERTLERFADDVRGLGTQSGYELTDPVERVVAGVRARQWDAVSGDGSAATKIREVVFIEDGTAWRVQLASTPDHFDENTGALRDLLDTWQFA